MPSDEIRKITEFYESHAGKKALKVTDAAAKGMLNYIAGLQQKTVAENDAPFLEQIKRLSARPRKRNKAGRHDSGPGLLRGL